MNLCVVALRPASSRLLCSSRRALPPRCQQQPHRLPFSSSCPKQADVGAALARVQVARGMHDALRHEARSRQRIMSLFRTLAESRGYDPIETPLVEDARLYGRTLGDASDIVMREMYAVAPAAPAPQRARTVIAGEPPSGVLGGSATLPSSSLPLDDSDGPSHALEGAASVALERLVLRPEGTAGVVRAAVAHSLVTSASNAPLRLHYSGPMFRHERPQMGRYRQFTQLGVEVLCGGVADRGEGTATQLPAVQLKKSKAKLSASLQAGASADDSHVASAAPTAEVWAPASVDVEVISLAYDFLCGALREEHAEVGPPVRGSEADGRLPGAAPPQRLPSPLKLRLHINSLGSKACMEAYEGRLSAYLEGHLGSLSQDSVARVRRGAFLRVLDSKDPADAAVIAAAPSMADSLSKASKARFEAVVQGLLQTLPGAVAENGDENSSARSSLGASPAAVGARPSRPQASSGIPIEIFVDKTLVRGLDYYRHTIFEFKAVDARANERKPTAEPIQPAAATAPATKAPKGAVVRSKAAPADIGSQLGTVLAGGRYDGMIELFGGPKGAPSIGWAAGLERLVLLSKFVNDAAGMPERQAAISIAILPISAPGGSQPSQDTTQSPTISAVDDGTQDGESPPGTIGSIRAASAHVSIDPRVAMGLRLCNLMTMAPDAHPSEYRGASGSGVVVHVSHVIRPAGKQVAAAAKLGATHAFLIGPDELKAGKVTIKDLRSGKQTEQRLPLRTLGVDAAPRSDSGVEDAEAPAPQETEAAELQRLFWPHIFG